MKFLESIAVQEGAIRHSSYHQQRMKQSAGVEIELEALLRESFPDLNHTLIYKFRIEYDGEGVISTTLSPYSLRPVRQLILIEADKSLDYHLKYADRSALDKYAQGLPSGQIPLLTRGGFITDTTYTNVCFMDDRGNWVTPSTPLLKGVMRQSLLDRGAITEAPISREILGAYQSIALINAMIPLGEVVLPMGCIIF